jgi:plasmid stabilization system protein ParE
MAIEFIIKESAMQDVVEIIDWYNSKRSALGDRFYRELLNEFERIKQTSTLYAYYKKDFRRAILKHFPYLIIFKITEKEIIIYSVIYGGKNPALINKKIS